MTEGEERGYLGPSDGRGGETEKMYVMPGGYKLFSLRPDPRDPEDGRSSRSEASPALAGAEENAGVSAQATRTAYELTKAVQERLDQGRVRAVAEALRGRGQLFSEVAAVVVLILEKEYEKRLRLTVERLGPSAVANWSSEHVTVDFDAEGHPTISAKLEGDLAGSVLERVAGAVRELFEGEGAKDEEKVFFLFASEWLWTHAYLRATDRVAMEVGKEPLEVLSDRSSAERVEALLPADPVSYLTDMNETPLATFVRELGYDYARGLGVGRMELAELEALLGVGAEGTRQAGPLPKWRDGHLPTLSPVTYQSLREAIVRGDSFEEVAGTPWPVAIIGEEGKTQGQAVLRPPAVDEHVLMPLETVEAWATEMWRQRGELSDLDADALDALSAIWIVQAADPRDGAVTGVDDLLKMRGIKKKRGAEGRRGGYEPEQRADMLRALNHIQNIWLEMDGVEVYEGAGKRRKPVRKSVQSRAFVVTDRMSQMRLDGHMDVEKFRFVPGEIFARFLMGAGRQVALLSAEALRYDPYRQKWEKRLARYLSWQWRTRARTGEYLRPYKVTTLLERAGERLNQRRPSQTKERLEKALDTLQRDGVVAGWQYADFDSWWEEVKAKRKGWARVWLSATVVIEPPEAIKDGYRKGVGRGGATGGKTLRALAGPSFSGAEVRKKRRKLGISQLRAAEQMGITQSRLSRVESGKLLPSGSLKTTLEQWLQEKTSVPTDAEGKT